MTNLLGEYVEVFEEEKEYVWRGGREEGSGNICEGKRKEGATDAASTGVDVVFRRRRG